MSERHLILNQYRDTPLPGGRICQTASIGNDAKTGRIQRATCDTGQWTFLAGNSIFVRSFTFSCLCLCLFGLPHWPRDRMPVLPEYLLPSAAVLMTVGVFVGMFRVRGVVRGTSLGAARGWFLAAGFAWISVGVASAVNAGSDARGEWQGSELLVWGACVLSLCPLISVLGARRPGNGAWTWFVVIPLFVVLSWPAWSESMAARRLQPVELSTPACVGFAIVLAMGAGNWMGTRLWLPVWCGAIGLGLVVATLSAAWPDESANRVNFRMAGVIVVAAAAMWSVLVLKSVTRVCDNQNGLSVTDTWSSVCGDFLTLYGIVWARRVADRVNVFANRERWPVRLTAYGLTAVDTETEQPKLNQPADVNDRIDEVVRWVLKRFVDAEWINSRTIPPM